MRGQLEQMMQRVDAWSPRLAIGVGLAGFFVGSLLLTRLPVWGFGVGCGLLSAAIVWLALSAKPVFKVVYPAVPSPTLVRPNPPSVASLPTVEPAPAKALAEPLEMVELPGGEFWMGSPDSEPGRYDDETQHRVKVSAFAMAKYPATQKLYQEVMGENPSYFKGESLPVEQVSWFDAVRFCNKLSERVGLKPCYRIEETGAEPDVEWDRTADGYRLPTEAEWEYACRAGTKTAFSFGDDLAQIGEYAWFDGNSEMQTHEIGTKKSNGRGLHDLHGNVREWCWDRYGDYPVTSDNDKSVSLVCPIGPPSGYMRVLRGGSFRVGPGYLRSASRHGSGPGYQGGSLGFRCVRGTRSAGVP
ncbi:MAG: formylglycine-generating enzyme family protein [Myxococcales bacterium]|nr:formylglycine-generating enzyme family protein [Myxococcales bacterium]